MRKTLLLIVLLFTSQFANAISQTELTCVARSVYFEGRDSLRKASGSWQISFDPEISEWGNPPARVSHTEYIGMRGEPSELKHLSNSRKRHQPRFRK